MTKYIFIFFCLMVNGLSATAQSGDAVSDSLTRLLHHTNDYTERQRLLGQLSWHFSGRDSARASQYAYRVLALAQHRKDNSGMGIAHYFIGGNFFDLNQIDSAIAHYEKGKKFLQHDTSKYGLQILARIWNNHGALLQRRGDEDAFVNMILNHAIPIHKKIKDSLGLARNYHNVGLSFQNVGNNERARDYQQKAASIFRHQQFVPEMTDTYIKFAELLTADTAIQNKPEAENALRMADSLLQKHPDHYSAIMYLNSKGLYEEVFNKNKEAALKNYISGETLAVNNGYYSLAATLANRIFYVYDAQKNYRHALDVGQHILRDYGRYLTPNGRLIQLRNIMNIYEKLGNITQAFQVQKQYIALSDSLSRAETAIKVHQLEQRFAAKEKENQIAQLNQEMNVQKIKTRQSRLWAVLAIVALLVLTGFIGVSNVFQRKQRLIARQEATLLQQHMEQMKQEEQIRLFSAMLEGQEKERNRLAVDLHDGLGGSLSGIKLKISNLAINGLNDPEQTKQHLSSIQKLLDASVNDLRHIARSMMPETLLKYGLDVALKDYCRGLENAGTHIRFQYYGAEHNMPQATQIMVYRIIQELISNALKHSGARQIIAQCMQNGNQLSITVEDDGKGFDLSENKKHEGMGLTNVRTRVHYLGGKLDIQTEQGIGTTINIELNYNNEQQNG